MEPHSAVASHGLVHEVPNMEIEASVDDDNLVADHITDTETVEAELKIAKTIRNGV